MVEQGLRAPACAQRDLEEPGEWEEGNERSGIEPMQCACQPALPRAISATSVSTWEGSSSSRVAPIEDDPSSPTEFKAASSSSLYPRHTAK